MRARDADGEGEMRAGLTRGMVLLSKVTGMSGEQLWVARARGSPSKRARVANISWLSRRMLLLCQAVAQLCSLYRAASKAGHPQHQRARSWAVCSGMKQYQVQEIQLAKSWISRA